MIEPYSKLKKMKIEVYIDDGYLIMKEKLFNITGEKSNYKTYSLINTKFKEDVFK